MCERKNWFESSVFALQILPTFSFFFVTGELLYTYIYIYMYDWTDDTTTFILVDQFPAVQTPPECSSNSIYPNKQSSNKTDRSKYQTTNRPTSLSPSRHTSSSLNENVDKEDVKQRRRYASDSNTTNNTTTSTNLLVSSFLQHLRNELKTTKIDKKHNYYRNKRQVTNTNKIFLFYSFILIIFTWLLILYTYI